MPEATTKRTTPEIHELYAALASAASKADALATHADTIGDLTFAYHIGQVWAAAMTGMAALNDARNVPPDHEG